MHLSLREFVCACASKEWLVLVLCCCFFVWAWLIFYTPAFRKIQQRMIGVGTLLLLFRASPTTRVTALRSEIYTTYNNTLLWRSLPKTTNNNNFPNTSLYNIWSPRLNETDQLVPILGLSIPLFLPKQSRRTKPTGGTSSNLRDKFLTEMLTTRRLLWFLIVVEYRCCPWQTWSTSCKFPILWSFVPCHIRILRHCGDISKHVQWLLGNFEGPHLVLKCTYTNFGRTWTDVPWMSSTEVLSFFVGEFYNTSSTTTCFFYQNCYCFELS
jgi:hypothetical protein